MRVLSVASASWPPAAPPSPIGGVIVSAVLPAAFGVDQGWSTGDAEQVPQGRRKGTLAGRVCKYTQAATW